MQGTSIKLDEKHQEFWMSGSKALNSLANEKISLRMEAVDRLLNGLTSMQSDLDVAGFSLAAVFVNDAIENLRAEKARLVPPN